MQLKKVIGVMEYQNDILRKDVERNRSERIKVFRQNKKIEHRHEE
jgi:hypothetical protein